MAKLADSALIGLLDAAPDAMIAIDETGSIVLINLRAEQLFDYRREELLGTNVERLVPIGDAQFLEYASDIQMTGRRRDGTEFSAAISMSTVETNAGRLRAATIRDSTEWHEVEAERLRVKVEAEGVRVVAETARVKAADEKKVAEGVRLEAEADRVKAEDEKKVAEGVRLEAEADRVKAEDEKKVAEGVRLEAEADRVKAEDEKKVAEGVRLEAEADRVKAEDEKKVAEGVRLEAEADRVIAEDEKKVTEQRFRSYFEYTPVGILLVNRDSLIVNVNPALCSITGYEANELRGVSLHVLLGPDYLERIEENQVRFAALVSGAVPSFGFEHSFVTKDGRSIWLAVTISVIRDEQGEPLEFVAAIQDFTSRKDAERVKDEFVSVTSHELRTPLTSIRGALGLLAGGAVGDLPDSAQRMLDIAVQSTDRLIRLINDLLDLERFSSGKLSLSLEDLDAVGLISRAVEEIRGAADVLEVEVRVGSVDGRVWADSDRIIQTLTNLVGNAIKFSPRASTVEVSAQIEGDYVHFVVEDHGLGIPADQLEAVFERFQQVDASDSRSNGGTGLGLTICRAIVEQHGGRIWAESVLGAGTKFNFTLPVVANIDGENLDDRLSEPGVVVCDDDAAIREVVKTTLEASGYRVWTASSGEEALTIVRTRQPDVVILDLLLPGIDGRETANALKGQEDTTDIPIVVLSVLTAEQMVVEGAASWVEKPIKEDVLLGALRKALGGANRQALVVEDDPQLAEVLKVTLARYGLKVRHARTGREAIRLGQAFIPDLLVLDLALPGGDGYSVIEWMRGQHWLSTLPVLVYTSFDLKEADRNRLRLGETRFLTKGRTPPALFEAKLEELLDWMAPEAPQR